MTTSKPSFPKDRGMPSGDIWTTAHDNGLLIVKLDNSATSSSGGCASADGSIGGVLVLALSQLWRRRRASR